MYSDLASVTAGLSLLGGLVIGGKLNAAILRIHGGARREDVGAASGG